MDMADKKDWVCGFCGSPLNHKEKVCKACACRPKEPAASAEREVCDALGKALELETEGRQFYVACAKNTLNADGQAMFKYLADEEQKHYDKVKEIFRAEHERGWCLHQKGIEGSPASGVFERNVPGGNLDRGSDALDALNVAIRAEDNSIALYQYLAMNASAKESRDIFLRLAAEEKRHRIILETEVEFITGTGEFHDFKTVTT
jgi:rubrerythrin